MRIGLLQWVRKGSLLGLASNPGSADFSISSVSGRRKLFQTSLDSASDFNPSKSSIACPHLEKPRVPFSGGCVCGGWGRLSATWRQGLNRHPLLLLLVVAGTQPSGQMSAPTLAETEMRERVWEWLIRRERERGMIDWEIDSQTTRVSKLKKMWTV